MKIMMRLMNKILPSCREISHLASQAMDEALPWRKRLELRLHLSMCSWCRSSIKQLELMRQISRRQTLSSARETGLSPEAKQRIAASLQETPDAQD